MAVSRTPASEWADMWNLAACKDADPNLFVSDKKGRQLEIDVGKARLICRSCPIMNECLLWALQHQVQSIMGDKLPLEGVWGGKTARERIDLLYTRKKFYGF